MLALDLIPSTPPKKAFPKDRVLLIVMARWPAPNRCKTRLAKELGANCAALIQQKLTLHTCKVAKDLSYKNISEIKLAISGVGLKHARNWGHAMGFNLISLQGKGNLGIRMKRQLINSKNTKNFKKFIIIGTDLPSLCESDISLAIHKLKRNDCVIGPSIDGGYWLIGFNKEQLKRNLIWPFTGINWGSKSVLKQTLKKARENNINYELLSLKNDLDTKQDMSPWIK